MTQPAPSFNLFHQWLLFVVATVFAVWVAFDHGMGDLVFGVDPTYLSWLIALIFLIFSLHAGHCSWRIAREADALRRLIATAADDAQKPAQSHSLAAQYIAATQRRATAQPGETYDASGGLLVDVLVENVRGQHEVGWFVSGALVKLGLLGTVIGFVLMLRSLVFSDSFEMSDVQDLLSSMTLGMGVALTTTLVGVVTSVLLGLQYLLADRGADRFVADTVYYSETALGPVTR